ncbi:MAG: GcrA family cell cycle regulator, partial [Pseudomonadota bacterium]
AKPKPVVRRRVAPVEKPRPVFIAEEPIIGAGILDLTERMCRWPIGDPKSPDFKFCGRKLTGGQTYCAQHAAMAYQPPQSRRRDDDDREQRRRAASSRF